MLMHYRAAVQVNITLEQSNNKAIDALHTHMQQQNRIDSVCRKFTRSNKNDTECPLKSRCPVNSAKSSLRTV